MPQRHWTSARLLLLTFAPSAAHRRHSRSPCETQNCVTQAAEPRAARWPDAIIWARLAEADLDCLSELRRSCVNPWPEGHALHLRKNARFAARRRDDTARQLPGAHAERRDHLKQRLIRRNRRSSDLELRTPRQSERWSFGVRCGALGAAPAHPLRSEGGGRAGDFHKATLPNRPGGV